MTADMIATLEHEHGARVLDDHFAGRISPEDEAALRAHLPGCADCRRRYQRHLLLAQLDRRALPAEERIARGLGLRPRGWRPWPVLIAPALAAAALVWVLLPRAGGAPEIAAPAVRGGPPVAGLWIYRVGPAGPRLVDTTIAAGDELAFAYGNPGAKAHLLLFAVDEHRHVYWYHPAWREGAPAPAPVSAAPGPGPHELREAVWHTLDGRRLELLAVLSDAPIAVEAVERAAAQGGGALDALAAGPGVVVARRTLVVAP